MILFILKLISCYSFSFLKYPHRDIYNIDNVLIKWNYPNNLTVPIQYNLSLYQNNNYLEILDSQVITNKSLIGIYNNYKWNINNEWYGPDFNLRLNIKDRFTLYSNTGSKFTIINYPYNNYYKSISFILIMLVVLFLYIYLTNSGYKKRYAGNEKQLLY